MFNVKAILWGKTGPFCEASASSLPKLNNVKRPLCMQTRKNRRNRMRSFFAILKKLFFTFLNTKKNDENLMKSWTLIRINNQASPRTNFQQKIVRNFVIFHIEQHYESVIYYTRKCYHHEWVLNVNSKFSLFFFFQFFIK